MYLNGHNCPHCQVTAGFELRNEFYYTCPSCAKPFIYSNSITHIPERLVYRTETMSPIMLAANGKIGQDNFTVSGCMTLFQTNTVINLYSISWANGLTHYLLETEGDYALLDEQVEIKGGDPLKKTTVAKNVKTNQYGLLYCYSMCRTTGVAFRGTGKMPVFPVHDSVFCSYFSADKKTFYAIALKHGMTLLCGRSVDLDELNLIPKRNIDTWSV